MSNSAQGEPTITTQVARDSRPPRQPRGSLTGHTLASKAWALLRLPLAVVAAAIAGVLALVGAAAASARPAVFLGAGLAAFMAATAAGTALVTRKLPQQRRRRTRLVAVTVGVLAGVAVFGVTALVPVGDPQLPPAPVAGQQYWELPTGSQIAYVHLPAQGTSRPTPVVFLHGGPGVADMAGDAAYLGRLTRDGFDVWVYDQVGTGRSSRLQDPRHYTIARNVADLEAIRQRIGADRLVLLGHSWGAQVAAGYLAAYPQHVARVVFSSPGALAPAVDDGSDARVRDRLTRGQQLGLYRLLVRPRVLLAYTLLQVNPRAAHAFVGDAEMDARNDRVYNHGRPGAHCRGASPGPALHGLGFYAYQFPQSAAARPWADPRPQLAHNPTPALVIKGSCDYLSWASGVHYRQALPNAERSTCTMPATTPTRTSPPPSWGSSGPSSPAGRCRSRRSPALASRPTTKAPKVICRCPDAGRRPGQLSVEPYGDDPRSPGRRRWAIDSCLSVVINLS